MSFSKKFRIDFPKGLQQRFRCYWHVMHPVTFDPNEIYRMSFTDEAWAAWHLLKKTRREILKDGYRWTYEWDWSDRPLPEYMPKMANLSWECRDDYPSVEVKENELSEEWREDMRAWILEAYRYKWLGEVLKRQLEYLIKLHYTYKQRGYSQVIDKEYARVNTPAQLLAIWPELIPFLPSEERDLMRHRHMKFSPPREWDNEQQAIFNAEKGMDEINHALQTMSLIPEKIDATYPHLAD